MEYDYIIVGQGLAGSLMAYQLITCKQRVLVVDKNDTFTSSKIAAGMFTPLSGKRLAISWMADELLPCLKNTYTELEVLLQHKFIHHQPVQISFSSVKEQNDFYGNRQSAILNHLDTNVNVHKGMHAPYGGFEVLNSGWLDTSGLLAALKAHLLAIGSYSNEVFDYSQLVKHSASWQYKNIHVKGVICCEGYKNKQNPFFGHIPIIENKGDVFLVQTDCLGDDKIYKRGAYAVHQGNHQYKVGSNYHWDNGNEQPDEKGHQELSKKTEQLINGEFKVVQHVAGIRPTTKDRRPVLGQHPTHEGLYLFNGLGTKGVMLAPYFSKVMADLILLKKEIPEEVNLTRFNS